MLADPLSLVGPGLTHGDALAQRVGKFICRFARLEPCAAVILPLWVLVSYVFERWRWCSYLHISSPERGCGKSTLGDVLGDLCFNGAPPQYGTAAAMRDYIGEHYPCTLIIDEWDSMPTDTRKLYNAFLNTGTRSTGVYRYKYKGEVVSMRTFGPKVIIGRATVILDGPLQSRCIPITMHKAKKGEIDRYDESAQAEGEQLQARLQHWSEIFQAQRVIAEPVMEHIDLRHEDIARPLLSLADHCGGKWPVEGRKAIAALLSEPQEPEPENQLLRLIKRYQRTLPEGTPFFETRVFCDWANKQYDRPWSEKGPLTWSKVGVALRAYRIFSDHRRVGSKTLRGYWFNHFTEKFKRYL